MAANTQNYPKLTLNIEGQSKITDMYNIQTFLPSRKIESEVTIDNTDDYVSLFSSSTLPVRKVIIEAPYYDATVEQEYTIDVKTIYNHPVSGNIESVESVEGINIKNYPETYGGRIVDILVKTSASTEYPKTIKSRIYAWED